MRWMEKPLSLSPAIPASYVQGTLSESDLGKVKVGSRISGYSYESYTSFTAEITEISKYPATSQSYWSSDMNPNASSYPFLAYIENADGLSDYEYAELKIEEDASTSADSIYIDKMYIRKENGQSYVYIKGEDGLCEKTVCPHRKDSLRQHH